MGNIDPSKEAASRSVSQPQHAGAMSNQIRVMGDNECAPQKLVRLVGCRDPKARAERTHPESWTSRFGETNR